MIYVEDDFTIGGTDAQMIARCTKENKRLTAENQRYRKALEEITEYAGPINQSFCEDITGMRNIARAALEG